MAWNSTVSQPGFAGWGAMLVRSSNRQKSPTSIKSLSSFFCLTENCA